MNPRVPISTFSACFAEASLPLHPISYAKMFYDKISKHDCNIWLVNTGYFLYLFRWINGRYGIGRRIPFEDSMKIIENIVNGKLEKVETYKFRCFNFEVPEHCPGIISDLMHPQRSWSSRI